MNTKMIALSIIGMACCLGSVAQGLSAQEQEYLETLEQELPGTLMNNPIEIELQTFGDDYRAKVVKADNPAGAAYQVRVKSAKARPWDISVTGALTAGIDEGDAVTVAFWARADKPDSRTGKGHIQLRLQQKAAPYSGVLEERVEVSEDWQLYEVSGVSGFTLSADQMSVAFNIGDHKQTLEFGPFYVLDLGAE